MRAAAGLAGLAGLLALIAASCGSPAARTVAPASPALTAPVSPSPPPASPSPSPSPATRPSSGTGRSPTPFRSSAAPPAGSAGCSPDLASQLAATHGASQLITVDDASYASSYATVELWSRSGTCWVDAGGPWTGRVGASGVSDHRREGDGSTPTGAYGIGSVIYGIAANPGVAYSYHQLVCGDWWDEDPATPAYNTFQHVACGQAPPFGGGSEALWTETVAYQHFVVVDYNTNPVVPGAGSGVFIHDDVGGPTAGCVSLPPAELDVLLNWLSPAKSPLVVIGTDAEIRRF